MDTLVEQVVRRDRTPRYTLNVVLIILIAAAVPAFFMVLGKLIERYYLVVIGLFLLLFAVYLAWYFITSLKFEYEYAVLGSTFRVDKVIAQRRRKKVLKLDIKEIDGIFFYSDEKMSALKLNKVYDVAARSYDEQNLVATFPAENGRKNAIVFCPKEKILTAMKPYFNREVALAVYRDKLL